MFQTLELQYLNKLVEGEVRDFASPKPFHSLKIQCLDHKGIKPKDLEIPDISIPLAMVVKRKPAFVEFQGVRGLIPRLKRDADTSLFQLIGRLELSRTIAVFALKLRQSAKTVKKSVVCDVDTNNHRVKRVAGYPCPMLVSSFEQLRQMRLQAIPASVFTIDTVIPFFQCQEVVVDIAKVVKHIAQAHVFRMFAYLIFIRSASAFLFSLSLFCHWISRITSLTPEQWVGRHATLR